MDVESGAEESLGDARATIPKRQSEADEQVRRRLRYKRSVSALLDGAPEQRSSNDNDDGNVWSRIVGREF